MKKKHEPGLRQLVDRFERLRMHCPRHSAAVLCRSIGLPYSTLRRWRDRRRTAGVIRRQPGPAKHTALPVADFRSRVAHLDHGSTRTSGTGPLIRTFRQSISRRRLQSFIARLRRRHLRRLRHAKLHVTWHLPNLAWAIDALHLRTSPGDPGVVVVLARDLASHFHFDPLGPQGRIRPAQPPLAPATLLARHGAPLLLKRDNGAPFNASIIDDFLAGNGILPLEQLDLLLS